MIQKETLMQDIIDICSEWILKLFAVSLLY